MSTVYIKQGDTNRSISDTLTIGTLPINLADCTVSFVMKNRRTGVKTSHAATIVSASAGTVSVALQPEAVADVGDFNCEWSVLFPNTATLTVPSEGYIVLSIVKNVTSAD